MQFKYFFLKQKGYIKGPFLLANLPNMFATHSVYKDDLISPDKYHWYPVDSFLARPKKEVEEVPLEIDPKLLDPVFQTLRMCGNDAPESVPEYVPEYVPLTLGEQIACTLDLPFAPRRSVRRLWDGIVHGEVRAKTMLWTAVVAFLLIFILDAASMWFFLRNRAWIPLATALGCAILFAAFLLGVSALLNRHTLVEAKKAVAMQFAQLLLTQTLLVYSVGMPMLAIQISTGGFPAAGLKHILIASAISGIALILGIVSTVLGIVFCRKCTAQTTSHCVWVSIVVLLLSILYVATVSLPNLKFLS